MNEKTDSVEVVRCKDCYWYKTNRPDPVCLNRFNGLLFPKPDDYCSYGERKRTNE